MLLRCGHVYVYDCLWIKPPHPKIAVCFCPERNWFFWFNSEARFHGHGQLAVGEAEFPPVLTKDCYLDLSQVCAGSPQELATASDRGLLPAPLLSKVVRALGSPIFTLPDINRKLALANLSALARPPSNS